MRNPITHAPGRRALTPLLLLILVPAAVRADDNGATAFRPHMLAGSHGGSLPYSLFIPRNLDPSKKYPLVLFLHGADERGSDNRRQLRDIEPWAKESIQSRYPCFIHGIGLDENDQIEEARWVQVD